MEIPAWVVDVVLAVLGAIAVAAVGWIGSTLAKLRRQSAQIVGLLEWMKLQDEAHDAKIVALLPLLEKGLRVAVSTRQTMYWLAEQTTPPGVSPPPPAEGG